jgi:hypothetical protein
VHTSVPWKLSAASAKKTAEWGHPATRDRQATSRVVDAAVPVTGVKLLAT